MCKTRGWIRLGIKTESWIQIHHTSKRKVGFGSTTIQNGKLDSDSQQFKTESWIRIHNTSKREVGFGSTTIQTESWLRIHNTSKRKVGFGSTTLQNGKLDSDPQHFKTKSRIRIHNISKRKVRFGSQHCFTYRRIPLHIMHGERRGGAASVELTLSSNMARSGTSSRNLNFSLHTGFRPIGMKNE